MHDAIVIGAGVGGLAAAIVLAARNKRVLVLEAAAQPGGKAAVSQIDGIEVDTGPSVLTMPDVFQGLFELAGMDIESTLKLRQSSPSFRYLYPDGAVVDVHHELADTIDSVRQSLGADAAKDLESFLAYSKRIWDAAAPVFVYGNAPSFTGVLSHGFKAMTAIASIDPWSVMYGAIRKRVRSTHLRRLLARYATYNGSDVRSAPATLNCIAHVELALGGFGVEGGMYQLVRSLSEAATRLGVEIRCNTPVASLEMNRQQVTGVRCADGNIIQAPQVVANADVAQVVQHLLPEGTRHGIRLRGEPSMSGYNAIFKAKRRENSQARVAHTVLFPENYEQEFADIFDHDRPPQEPTIYLCSQETCHGRKGWPEHEPLFVMANAPAEPASGSRDASIWYQLGHVVRERSISFGLIERSDQVVWSRSPTQLAQRFEGSRGSLYGLASNGPTAAFQRPANTVPQINGLFLASGSAHPGGGLPLAALSGRAAAAAALSLNP
jgi:phytoene desaturase